LKPENCEFEKECIKYLGLIISHNHVKMDEVKVQGILEWPTPTKVKDVQAFLGFANFYRQFIKDFSKAARPLMQLTRKDIEWDWMQEAEQAFQDLKQAFTTAPMLVMRDPEKPMRVETDASDFAYGAVLSQLEDDNKWHPSAYIATSPMSMDAQYARKPRTSHICHTFLCNQRKYLNNLSSSSPRTSSSNCQNLKATTQSL
jgi:hypothetical protein